MRGNSPRTVCPLPPARKPIDIDKRGIPGRVDDLPLRDKDEIRALRLHRTYFGQKDYQQACIVERMVRDLDMDIEVVVLPTVREPDGLALSSRNVNLTPEERRQAPMLYQTLCWAAERIKGGEHNARVLEEGMQRMIHEGTTATIDYVALCHPETLEPLEQVAGPAVALLAVRFSKARLIDNLLINVH